MAHKKKPKRRKHQRRSVKSDTSIGSLEVPIEEDESQRLIEQWAGERSGAWASRGFDFQHTVAAWLAAKLVSGDLSADGLVPEGLEDLSIESESVRHVQIKSRAEHLGAFPVSIASGHIVNAWFRHRGRGSKTAGLTVVLERGVVGERSLTDFNASLSNQLSLESELRASIAVRLTKQGLSDTHLVELLDQTSVYGASWSFIEDESMSLLGEAFNTLSPAVLKYLARELRAIISETTNQNAKAARYEDRCALDRSELIRRCELFIEQVDLKALNAAITRGICSSVSLAEELDDDRFYEGVATQPGHVAAGLVVPRPDLIGETVTGIQETSSVILTGPSGVGKSAILWSIPHALPGVLWFRVNRLTSDDVSEVLRLCRSHAISESNPIGLLIDDAGRGEFSGWPLLRDTVMGTPGLFIISTARQEDLLTLGDLTSSTTVTVSLDESGAETIFHGLRNRKATDSPHWREAFEKSQGLTLEFTHLLTRGQRLDEVIRDQVRRRISERRDIELDLLSLAATADRWLAHLPVDGAAAACGVSQIELKKPITRLAKEHLLVEVDGTISGVHQLRSTAISNAIHDLPPPTLSLTMSRLLSVLQPDQIRRLIPNALRDAPQTEQWIHDAALRDYDNLGKLTAYLRGLRIFDFYERAITWVDIAEKHAIPLAVQPVAHLLAITGTQLPSFFPEEFTGAVAAMMAVPEAPRRLGVIDAIGSQRLAEVIAGAIDVGQASELIFELQGSSIQLVADMKSALTPSSPLFKSMQRASVWQLAKLLDTVKALDSGFADALIDLCGGETSIIERIRDADPWITDLWVEEPADEVVGCARVLHVSDSVNGDPHDRIVELGRLLLRCLPRTSRVDAKLFLPGGSDYQIGEYQFGSTELSRKHDHSELKVTWNQQRIQVTNTVLGMTDTDRLYAARPLLERASRVLRLLGNAFAAADIRQLGASRLVDEVNELGYSANQIGPSFGGHPRVIDIKDEWGSGLITTDPLSGIVTDLTNNVLPRLAKPNDRAALAIHLKSHVIGKSLSRAQQEPWHLLGYDRFPESLGTIEADLHRLQAIIAELAIDPTAGAPLTFAARSGKHEDALKRASDAARARARRRLTERKDQLEQMCTDAGWRISVFMSSGENVPHLSERLVAIHVQSVLEWIRDFEKVASALLSAALPEETFLLVPLRDGRPVESLAMNITLSPLPGGKLGAWAPLLKPPHETPLSLAIEELTHAVQVQSGIRALPDNGRMHPTVIDILENAEREFDRSKGCIEKLPSDPLVNQILNTVANLEAKLEREKAGESVGGGVAKEIFDALTLSHQTEVCEALTWSRLMALEWDINRDEALRIFDLI